jgi:hypothetical protein
MLVSQNHKVDMLLREWWQLLNSYLQKDGIFLIRAKMVQLHTVVSPHTVHAANCN